MNGNDAKGVVAGKSLTQSAKDAGYAKSTAEKKSYAILQRPLVKSALTNALERSGVTLQHIVQPIADALKATKSFVNEHVLMIQSQVPDHKIRLEASRDAVALLGGIPKVGEGTPTAHGLNLFIAVDHGQRPKPETYTQTHGSGGRMLMSTLAVGTARSLNDSAA